MGVEVLVGGVGGVVVGVGGSFRSGREENMAAVMAAPDAAEQAAMRANVVFDMVASRRMLRLDCEGARGPYRCRCSRLVLLFHCQVRVSAGSKRVWMIGSHVSRAEMPTLHHARVFPNE